MRRLPASEVNHLVELNKLRHLISQESISMAGIASSVAELIPAIKKNFSEFIAKFNVGDKQVKLSGDQTSFTGAISKRPYLSLESIGVFVPEGLSSTYLDYLKVLQEAVNYLHANLEKNLSTFSDEVGAIITNRQLKSSMPVNRDYNKMEKERQALTEAIGKCFTDGSTKATASYGDVVSNNSEWSQVFRLANAVTETIGKIDRDKLQKQSTECDDQLSVIINQIKAGDFKEAGPEVVQNLSAGAYQIGAELEMFAVIYFKVNSLTQAVNDSMDAILKIIKNDEDSEQAGK